MRRLFPMVRGLLALALLFVALQPARADFEVTDSKGRRIKLKDNGTWSYVDADDGTKGTGPTAASARPAAQADIELTQRVDIPGGCRFVVLLTNNLPYEISSLVPEFAALRTNGVVYTSQLTGFAWVKPGNKQVRHVEF